jgi:hypothetical protein
MSRRFAIDTSGDARGGVAVIRLVCDDPADVFRAMGVRPVAVGDARVRRVFGLDDALVARPDGRTLLVMPHGGRGLLRVLRDQLLESGFEPDRPGSTCPAFPEAGDPIAARTLATLARAASPRATDLLLDQPRRWRAQPSDGPEADARVLNRLVTPPAVVAVGGANIGKSSLLNAVAGGSVALVFDRPNTTRDAVGVLVDLDGLVVRWVDTPGVGSRPDRGHEHLHRAALDGADAATASADLVLRCADAASAGPEGLGASHPLSLTVATRTDRVTPSFDCDAATSATTGRGVPELARLIRRTLVPDSALADPGPWRFWV